MMDVKEALRRAARRHRLFPPNSSLVVGVSGGADSLALLHALHALSQQRTLRISLHVATLDHGLRGEQSADDARYVVETSAAWGIPVISERVDTAAIAREQRMGIEAAARYARYDFFSRVARAAGAQRVAVAHHADDQAETVLMRLLRGTGIDGLASMGYVSPMPYHPDLTLIRPLLMVRRATIEAYCAEHGLQPRQDATNDDVSLTRNFTRLRLLPAAEEQFPEARAALVHLAEIAAVEHDYMQGAFEAAIMPFVERSASRITLDRKTFMRSHLALQRRFVLWAVRALDSPKEMRYEHIVSTVETLVHGESGVEIQLPGSITIRLTRELVVVAK